MFWKAFYLKKHLVKYIYSWIINHLTYIFTEVGHFKMVLEILIHVPIWQKWKIPLLAMFAKGNSWEGRMPLNPAPHKVPVFFDTCSSPCFSSTPLTILFNTSVVVTCADSMNRCRLFSVLMNKSSVHGIQCFPEPPLHNLWSWASDEINNKKKRI